VGDKLPTATLYEGSPTNKVDLAQLIGNKKAIVFALPGAFTPGCTKVRQLSIIYKSYNILCYHFFTNCL